MFAEFVQQTTTWAPACETAYEEASVISDEEKTNILTTNNLLRQIMAKGVGTGFPPAANMRELVRLKISY